ncbi:MAG: uracil-DNA glycosylase [Rhodospirillales bacterium]|nr:uracil-DNA glycosylase [Rhodospirillales bacterium]
MGPGGDCTRCGRLVAYRQKMRREIPDGHNAPVSAFGELDAKLLVVGLAPGRLGANRSGRPFTGDYAGDLLYSSLLGVGLAQGHYRAVPDDGLELKATRITNAVRCLPPGNQPTTQEIATCNGFLAAEIAAMGKLKVVLALGLIAHKAVLRALGLKQSFCPFLHGAQHRLPGGPILADSYHCSRYNTNTGRLTEAMFLAVLEGIVDEL